MSCRVSRSGRSSLCRNSFASVGRKEEYFDRNLLHKSQMLVERGQEGDATAGEGGAEAAESGYGPCMWCALFRSQSASRARMRPTRPGHAAHALRRPLTACLTLQL